MVGAGVALPWSEATLELLLSDEGMRKCLSATALEAVDGRGASRLARALTGLR